MNRRDRIFETQQRCLSAIQVEIGITNGRLVRNDSCCSGKVRDKIDQGMSEEENSIPS